MSSWSTKKVLGRTLFPRVYQLVNYWYSQCFCWKLFTNTSFSTRTWFVVTSEGQGLTWCYWGLMVHGSCKDHIGDHRLWPNLEGHLLVTTCQSLLFLLLVILRQPARWNDMKMIDNGRHCETMMIDNGNRQWQGSVCRLRPKHMTADSSTFTLTNVLQKK